MVQDHFISLNNSNSFDNSSWCALYIDFLNGLIRHILEWSSVQSLDRLGRRGDVGYYSSEVLFQSFLTEALVSGSGMGGNVHSFMLSIRISSADYGVAHTLQCALVVMACDIPHPCKFPSLDSC